MLLPMELLFYFHGSKYYTVKHFIEVNLLPWKYKISHGSKIYSHGIKLKKAWK